MKFTLPTECTILIENPLLLSGLPCTVMLPGRWMHLACMHRNPVCRQTGSISQIPRGGGDSWYISYVEGRVWHQISCCMEIKRLCVKHVWEFVCGWWLLKPDIIHTHPNNTFYINDYKKEITLYKLLTSFEVEETIPPFYKRGDCSKHQSENWALILACSSDDEV